MRYALILAGGSGTRLWPASRASLPKQLIPLIRGRSLLSLSFERLEGLVGTGRLMVCAGERERTGVLRELPRLPPRCYLGEPTSRDTFAALGFASAVIVKADPSATMGVFTADHLIGDTERFRGIVESGYSIVEESPDILVTFGIPPRFPATGFGYLCLGEPSLRGSCAVSRFKEKPARAAAEEYFTAGPDRYLWNSGMFIWRAATFLDCVRRYRPESVDAISRAADAWRGDAFPAEVEGVYGSIEKISVDYAVMEPASRDSRVKVVCLRMDVPWQDIGSWPAYAETCPGDADGNALAAETLALLDTSGTLVFSSEPDHLVAALGCDDLLIIHTPDTTLVCRKDRAEDIKKLLTAAAERFGSRFT